MRRVLKPVTVMFLTAGVFPALCGCGQVIWRSRLEPALEQARKDGRLVLVEVWSPFHADSRRMDREVFNDQEVFDAMADTIPVRLDANIDRKYVREHEIAKLPAFVVHHPDGSTVRKRQGYMTSVQFRAFVIGAKLNR